MFYIIGFYVLLIITFFLILKIYRMFTLLSNMEDFFLEIKDLANRSLTKMKQIDSTGHFENDDEVGWTFQVIQGIIRDIDNFFIENSTEKNS